MATNKPRVTVTLEPEVYASVRELAQINGDSMSSIIAEIVGAAQETIQTVIEAGKRYAALEAGMQAEVRARFDRVTDEVLPKADALSSELLGLFDNIPEAEDPRPVIRGSGPPSPPPPPTKSGDEG